MKKLKLILAAVGVMTFFASCDKDEKDPVVTLNKATISAKWVVSNSVEYKSFEFNESGNYIVVKNPQEKSLTEQVILFGTYEIINDNTVLLSNFGTLTVSDINEKSISFLVQLSGSPDMETVVNASKQAEMESSARTDLICRTWNMVSINGEEVVGTENELSVLFSKAGTYFVEFVNPMEEDDGGLAYWKWSDNTETKFLYSWDTPPVWYEDDIVEVVELTNHILKIIENIEGGGEELYEFVPVVNTKSAAQKPVNDTKSYKQIKNGFLKR